MVTGATVPAVPLGEDVPIPSLLVLVTWLVIAGVVLFALPALALGARGLFRRRGYSPVEPGDRSTIVLLITGRAIVLLLVLALTALVLVSSVGALVKDVELHGAVYVFCVLDLLLAALILLTFGRPEPRPARRRASPAGR